MAVLPLKSNPLRSARQRKPLWLTEPCACPAPQQLHKDSSPPQYSCNVLFLKIAFLWEHRWADKPICSLEPPFCPRLSATGSPMQFPDLHISQYIYFSAGAACSHTADWSSCAAATRNTKCVTMIAQSALCNSSSWGYQQLYTSPYST